MSADFWAGYVSGAVGIIIGNPLDLIKTRLQAGKTALYADAASAGNTPQSFRGQFENAGTLVRGEQTQASLYLDSSKANLKSQHRRVQSYPWIWRSQRASLRDLQPHAFPHQYVLFCKPPSFVHEDMARRRYRWLGQLRRLRPN
jgi:hypothetical protein